MMHTTTVRLASASPTRARLLESAGIAFVQEGVAFDEDALKFTDAKSFVYHATLGKYEAALRQYGYEQMPLLVADTVISVAGQIIRKAHSREDARRILLMQSGSVVSIMTCMIYKTTAFELLDLSITNYRFRPFEKEDLEAYLQSGAWEGKAGACMVEGFCKPYIQEVQGFESCAMGLSVEVLQYYM